MVDAVPGGGRAEGVLAAAQGARGVHAPHPLRGSLTDHPSVLSGLYLLPTCIPSLHACFPLSVAMRSPDHSVVVGKMVCMERFRVRALCTTLKTQSVNRKSNVLSAAQDENTRYVCIGPVNKVINMLCCWFEDPESDAFKRCGPGPC